MTASEAIKELHEIRPRGGIIPQKRSEAIDVAINALEKQIPKKPMINGANWYRCANGCEIHKKQFEKDWYCPKCGQKLYWSDEE